VAVKSLLLFTAALCATIPTLCAQGGTEPKPAAPAMPDAKHPDPKQQEHEILATLAGYWECSMKAEAMPGVPGMEKPIESKGSEQAELICNGLWVKSVINGTHDGRPFQGLWLVGYDPFRKQYSGIWVSSDDQECGACTLDGSYDAATKTWTWKGQTSHGEMRSTIAFRDADTSLETCYMKGSDGKEAKCMEITRKRSSAPIAAEASAKALAKLSKEHEVLHNDVGDWDATVKCSESPGEEKATERVSAICNGRWLWSDFEGRMGGTPFEGHGVVGYDPKQKQYVSFWLSSMCPTFSQTTGTFDAAKHAYTFQGKTVDPTGSPMTIKETLTWKDDDTRVLQMEFKCPDKASNMEITYKRRSKS
jgi:hypothetical protein